MKGKAFQRTDRAIQSAFAALLECKSFEEMTVQDILEKTPVSRATFYAHYRDKYEIAEQMLAEFVEHYQYALHSFEYTFDTLSDNTRSLEALLHDSKSRLIALSRIHTGKVDLKSEIARILRAFYLKTHTGERADLQAEIYAQVMLLFQMESLTGDGKTYADVREIALQPMLSILQLEGDGELLRLLRRKLDPGGK